MRDRYKVWRRASLLLAMLMGVALVAPALSVAIDCPEQVVFEFLNKSIGRSKNVRVLDPVCDTPPTDVACGEGCLIDIQSGLKSKNEPLATILTGTMKTCDPEPTDEVNGACDSFGVPPDSVKIRVVDLEGKVVKPVQIVGVPENTEDNQIQALRLMVSGLLSGNRFFGRAMAQFPDAPNPNERAVGVHLLFPPAVVQTDIHDERTFSGVKSFFPETLFDLFLKSRIPVDPADPNSPTIGLFTTTGRQ